MADGDEACGGGATGGCDGAATSCGGGDGITV